jgi:hypothetical protein
LKFWPIFVFKIKFEKYIFVILFGKTLKFEMELGEGMKLKRARPRTPLLKDWKATLLQYLETPSASIRDTPLQLLGAKQIGQGGY